MRLLPSLLLALTLGCGADPNAPAIPPAGDAGADPDGEAPAPDAPSRDWGPPVDPTLSVPTFDAATVARVRALRAMGAARGMRPDVVAKIGDSITESASFLSDIGHGWHELGAHGYLQPTVTYFSRTRFADGTNSLNRASSCAMGGWVAAYALAMDPMSALRNEMDYTRPAYAIVMYGTNDLDRIAPEEFTRDMTRILDIVESYGSVPVMSTIPDRLDRAEAGARVPAFNEAIRAMAASRHLPLMEFWRSLQDLPRKGIDPDGIHPSAYVSNGNVACGVLTPDGLRFGYNMRNLVALFALDRLRNLAQ